MSQIETPIGMANVTQAEFFRLLKGARRDIMPSQNNPTFTEWKDQGGGAVWGRSYPGWKNPGDAEAWFVVK